jgi:ParB family chromosome partitioning protein
LCYQERPRFSGGAYHPLLKRADQFLTKPLRQSFDIRRARAADLLALDDVVNQHVEALKARGLTSPYL